MKPSTAIILEEVDHLTYMGMSAAHICEVLNRTPSALIKLLYKYERRHIAGQFAAYRHELELKKKGVANGAENW